VRVIDLDCIPMLAADMVGAFRNRNDDGVRRSRPAVVLEQLRSQPAAVNPNSRVKSRIEVTAAAEDIGRDFVLFQVVRGPLGRGADQIGEEVPQDF
jgi:hypothetical protein